MKKVLDFNAEILPSGIIGRPRELAWPCKMFRVTLPHLGDSVDREFNAFELCVLKLLAYARYEPKDIADATCLPRDLVEIVLLRLYDRGKIDEHYQLLPDVLKTIEKLEADSPYENVKYETYVIFRESIGGAVLPMILGAKLSAEEVDEIDEYGNIKIKGGKISLRPIRIKLRSVKPPDVQEVIIALRTMARRRRVSGEIYRIPPAEFVAVANAPEQCELRVRMITQASGEWRILNPFGTGWSPELESVYWQVLQESQDESREFSCWQRKLIRSQTNRSENVQQKDEPRESYDMPENRSRYPELIAALNRKRKSGDEKISNIDVYAVLEWALYYVLQLVDTKPIVQFLQIETRENVVHRLKTALIGLGGRLPEDGYIPVPSDSQLKDFGYDHVARMQTVLPIAIVAAEKSANVRMDAVLQRYPDFVSRIRDLKSLRDPKQHGRIYWDEIYSDEDRDMMRQVVMSLIPSISFSSVTQERKTLGKSAFDEQMEAMLNLQDMFGVLEFNRLDSNLKGYLIQAERFWLNVRPRDTATGEAVFDALYFVNDLYAACQCAIRPFLDRERPKDFSLEKVNWKASSTGLGKLPTSLLTVQATMLQKTLAGNDQTLGACVIVWLFVSDAAHLHRVAAKQPSFLADLDNLLGLRKHANQACMMRADEIGQVRETTYKLIKNIMEE